MRCHSDAFGRVGRIGGGAAAAGGSAGGVSPSVGRVDHGLSRTVKEETTVPISFWRCS